MTTATIGSRFVEARFETSETTSKGLIRNEYPGEAGKAPRPQLRNPQLSEVGEVLKEKNQQDWLDYRNFAYAVAEGKKLSAKEIERLREVLLRIGRTVEQLDADAEIVKAVEQLSARDFAKEIEAATNEMKAASDEVRELEKKLHQARSRHHQAKHKATAAGYQRGEIEAKKNANHHLFATPATVTKAKAGK